MSLRDLSNACPHCGDSAGPFFLIPHTGKDAPCFTKGYWCGVCGKGWDARECDKKDWPDEFVSYEKIEIDE